MSLYGNKIFIPIVGVAVAISSIGCKTKKTETVTKTSGAPNSLKAEGFVVQTESFQNDYRASGSLVPNEEVDIHPEVSGRVTHIYFKEGANVSKGQILVQLYDAEIRAQIQKLRAQRQLQVKLLERQKELVNIGGISKQDYETTQTQIRSIDADIAYAEAQLRTTKIIAPFSGKIGIRSISEGAVISPTTVIATLQQTNPLKMDFTVPDKYKQALVTGKQVFFSITGSQENYSGKISAIDPGADMTTRTIKVRAIVPNSDGKLTPGAFANVLVPFESDENAILIPSQAVIPTTKEKKVAVVKDGKAQLQTVELGTRTEDKVEVVTGLEKGDTIIITGIMRVKPGMDVKITKVKS